MEREPVESWVAPGSLGCAMTEGRDCVLPEIRILRRGNARDGEVSVIAAPGTSSEIRLFRCGRGSGFDSVSHTHTHGTCG